MAPCFECVTHQFKSSKFETDDLVQLTTACTQMGEHTYSMGQWKAVEYAQVLRFAFLGEIIEPQCRRCLVVVNPSNSSPNSK